MLRAEDFNDEFSKLAMFFFDKNTEIVEHVIRMIAFVSKHSPLSRSPYLWSNAQKLHSMRWLYRMPSDAELLQISMQPEGKI